MSAETNKQDLVLVNKIRKGSREAFYQLVDRYEGKVMGLAMRFTRNHQDAEEVTQDVFTTVYLKIAEFEGKSAFSSWLYRVVVNTSFMKLRKRKQTEAMSLEDISPAMRQEYVDQFSTGFQRSDVMSSKKEILDALELAIQKLPEEYQSVFVLRDLNGLSNEEVSAALNITVPAVKSRLHRARLMLKKRLQRTWDDYTGKAAKSDLSVHMAQVA